MLLVPSLDLKDGRSRLVFWPGAASGTGSPTDRPEQIARAFVELGAPLLHLVDLDGAVRGAPVNTDAIQRISRAVAVPLQLAGGVDGPEQIELAFAAGATRVVVPLWAVAESVDVLRACLRVAGDWLAVGMDARPERLREYPWHGEPPTLRAVWWRCSPPRACAAWSSHTGHPRISRRFRPSSSTRISRFNWPAARHRSSTSGAAREAGAHALILGEALFTGAVDYVTATGNCHSEELTDH